MNNVVQMKKCSKCKYKGKLKICGICYKFSEYETDTNRIRKK